MHVHGLELSLIVVCPLQPSSRTSFTFSSRVAVSSCHAGMIVTDPELGADGIGVLPPSLANHADVNTMTTWSRMAWIGTTWSPGNTIRATTLPVHSFPVPPGNYQPNPSSTQQFHHPPGNYMVPFPPEPTPAKFVTLVMTPPVTSSQATPSPGYPAALPVRPQKAWLTRSGDWKPGDGMFDINQLYNFSLPMTVANTPHNTLRGHPGRSPGSGHTRGHYQLATATICSREIRNVGRISYSHRGPALEYLFKTTATIRAAQPAYFGKGPCQFAGAQPWRLQSAHQGSRPLGQSGASVSSPT